MSKRSFALAPWTPIAVADAANFTNGGYCALQGGGAGQLTYIREVRIGGLATASAPTNLLLAHDSTVGATLTALSTGQSDAPLDPSSAALATPVVPFTASTTKPQRSATLYLLDCSLNAFGDIYRWVAPDQAGSPGMIGASASLGEISLSCYTGGTAGLIQSHIIYETV